MTKRIGGFRRKTRHKLKRNIREKGKVSIRRFTQSFNLGEKVYLNTNPSIHKGVYFPRFHGLSGTIVKKQGVCYQVNIKDGNKLKTLIIHPIHLKKA